MANDDEKFKQLSKDNEELIKTVKGLGETIEKLKSKGIGMEASTSSMRN